MAQDPRGAGRSLASEKGSCSNSSASSPRGSFSGPFLRGRARCAACGPGAARARSVYTRTIADLPRRGAPVIQRVRARRCARRFFCDEPSCERKNFCERLPDVAAHARKTGRLEEAGTAESEVVRVVLTERRSNGPVEGFVHKLKLVKRQGYGRASFDPLRARVLAA